MEQNAKAELYLAFAAIFQRPRPEISDHLEELIELWAEEIPASRTQVQVLEDFCRKHPAGEKRLNTLWEHYIPLFETGKVEASPYASVHLNREKQVLGTESMAVKSFYEKAGYAIESNGELPDHLAVELEFAALLARDGQEEYLAEFKKVHLLPFLSVILPLIRNSGRPVYAAAAAILQDWQIHSEERG
ncbi:TorD/DmsD family molecular chaperone [Paradesulfitobacterium ferrireducens]|uniref:TorD/DmsD family molecular chaperone n=1 Tax=Paradesulfitobacterium ferrireducens TaxID=2816476 RepID=UPI001A8CE6BB|nr:molecular chaperone TorD family protein [Paradesulfitobacterium ferrireducens]